MTCPQKLFWFCLLLIGLLVGIAGPPMPRAVAIVAPPFNTNTYGCHLVWDGVIGADHYTVYLGNSPAGLAPVTNVTSTDAIFRIWQTNIQPWLGVTALNGTNESDMSKLLTKTNWLAGYVETSDTLTGPWQTVPGTAFLLETANPASFARMQGALSNNWPVLP